MVGEPLDPRMPGALALFLSNSLNWRLSADCEDILQLDELVAFARQTGELVMPEADRHTPIRAGRHSHQALMKELRAVRGLIVAMLTHTARGTPFEVGLHRAAGEQWHRAASLMTLDRHGRVQVVAHALQALPHLAFLSALRLVGDPSAGKLKVCEDARGCGFFFLDQTRNLSKRFCCSACSTYDRQTRFRRGRTGLMAAAEQP